MNKIITYRTATLKDLDYLMELEGKEIKTHETLDKFYALTANFQDSVKEYFKKCLASKDSLFFVACVNEKIVGFVFCKLEDYVPIFRYKKHLHILDVFVEPQFRRAGIAQRMFAEIKRFAKKKGVDFITLNVDVENIAAKNLYIKNGFVKRMDKMILRME
ncbi:MAG: GNAT family N-acetyltransferase [archaeon]